MVEIDRAPSNVPPCASPSARRVLVEIIGVQDVNEKLVVTLREEGVG